VTELVSILIPAYRAEAFIAETIRSALDQTWPRKEVIVVDDGSPDGTYGVARRFESANVRVVRQENGGAPSARNHAYRLAQGTYIQWLDADDLIHPNKIHLQLEGAQQGLTSRTLLTAAWGKFFTDVRRTRLEPDALWKDHSGVDWITTRFEDNVWMNPAVWLVSRWLTEAAGPWDPRLARSGDDDGEYVCRVAAASDHVRFVRDAIAHYRIGTVGSLNWNMETNATVLESLALSLEASVNCLLALKDSPRTRAAAACHLRTFSAYYYAADERLFEPLQALSLRLGHPLRKPTVGWKYKPFEWLLGERATRTLMTNWRASKVLLRRRLHFIGAP
jgi:glycosyltransferase involved in cell wall biosynthesis